MTITDDYPEHEKLRKVSERSQAIGEFLDYGLPRMGLAIYEKVTRPCECSRCRHGTPGRSLHTDEELTTVVDGAVQITEWVETHRTIQAILAEHFGIDLDKLEDEKRAMIEAMTRENE